MATQSQPLPLTFKPGDRVTLHPVTYSWLGMVEGTVVRSVCDVSAHLGEQEMVKIKLDTGRMFHAIASDVIAVEV